MVFLYNKTLSNFGYKKFNIKRFQQNTVSKRARFKVLTHNNRKFLESLGFKLKSKSKKWNI